MKCPFCGHGDTQVVETRDNDEYRIKRRRRCVACERRFTTFETVDMQMPQVIKQGGHRMDFCAEKLRTGFTRALHKRPVSTQLVDEALTRIQQHVLASGVREISSREIGEMVMNELARLDKVAYIRFASVYRSFQDISEFSDVIAEISRTV